jgi:hypothetical protein
VWWFAFSRTKASPPFEAPDEVEEKHMTQGDSRNFRVPKFGLGSFLLTTLLLAATVFPLPAQDRGAEVIDAIAMGTSTQLGRTISVKVTIYEFSTDEDRAVLVEAYKKGQHQGLVNALSKMRAVGRIAITGTTGYDLSYIRLIKTPNGRKIRFAADRMIRFAEAWYDTRTRDYDLTAGEIEINDSDKDKSSGVLLPAAQLIINKEGQLEFQLYQNPWKLTNIIDWHKAGVPE